MANRVITTGFDGNGNPVTFVKLVGQGGEGIVYDVSGSPSNLATNHIATNLVAKIYHKPVHGNTARKLELMAQIKTDRLLALSAWPVDVVRSKPGGDVVGLLMPKVVGHRPGHELYSPKDRIAKFPNASFPFLIRTCANIARSFAVVHAHGHVIGDVNHGNFLISQEATVKLIDCDSFQITNGGDQFLCEVGVSTHTPPELQGKPYTGVVRTPNHDNFGLAVILFQMLFAGRHPYSGRFKGSGEMSLERSITEFRFAYGDSAAAKQMTPPPGVPALSTVSDDVAELFGLAFSEAGAKGLRPTAPQWVAALEQLEKSVVRCSVNQSHHYLKSLPSCTWCQLESQFALILFPIAIKVQPHRRGSFSIERIRDQLKAIERPKLPALPVFDISNTNALPSAAAVARGKRRTPRVIVGCTLAAAVMIWAVVTMGGGGALLGLFLLPVVLAITDRDIKADRKMYRSRVEQLEAQCKGVVKRYRKEVKISTFDEQRRNYESRIQHYKDLPAERAQRLNQLEIDREKMQRQRYLDGFRITQHGINGIGDGRKATLQSFGIETAADVSYSMVMAVPGFGPSFTQSLITWRSELERNFRFDPNTPTDPADRAAVEGEIDAKQNSLEAELSAAPTTLQQTASRLCLQSDVLQKELLSAQSDLAQALADRRAIYGIGRFGRK